MLRFSSCFIVLLSLISLSALSQPNCNNEGVLSRESYTRFHTISRKPIPYTHIRESDVMWHTRIWRTIDLRDKFNHPLYYPLAPMTDRRSLFDLIICGINNGEVRAYANPAMDDEFTVSMRKEDVLKLLIKTDTVDSVDPDTGENIRIAVPDPVESSEVRQYWVKEDWFFDRQRSVMEVRIIGICPLIEMKDERGEFKGLTPLFWVYFPELRPLLAREEVYIRKNNGPKMSFDDLFFKRMFHSFIHKEDNVYDRPIISYTSGKEALLVSEDIQEKIREMESDLWHY